MEILINIKLCALKIIFLIFFIFSLGMTYAGSNSPKNSFLVGTKSPEPTQVSRPENFYEFFNKFKNDVIFQRRSTQEVIRTSSVNLLADPEPVVVKSLTKASNLKFPIIPNDDVMKKELLIYKINSISTKKVKVTVFKTDSGFLVSYFFELTDLHWMLVEIQDDST